MCYFYFKWIIYIHRINLSGIAQTTMLLGEYERMTRQLGNIENNIYFWFIILCSKFYLVTMEVGCVIFGMTPKKKNKKIWKGQRSWRMEWGGGLVGIQTAIHLGRYMGGIYWARDVWAVLTMLTVWHRQSEPENSWFGDHAHQRLCPVQRTFKADGKINLNKIYR